MAVVFDTGAVTTADILSGKASSKKQRVRTAVYTNVADAVYTVEWAAPNSSNLRPVATATIPAATFFQRDALLQPGRTKITIVTVTGPTIFEVGCDVIDDQAMGQ